MDECENRHTLGTPRLTFPSNLMRPFANKGPMIFETFCSTTPNESSGIISPESDRKRGRWT